MASSKAIQDIIKYCDPTNIIITNSQLSHWFQDGAGILQIDLGDLLQQDISFGLINSPSLSKSLWSVNNGSGLTISSDGSNQFYRFVAGKSELNIHAAFMADQSTVLPPVDLINATVIGSPVKIDAKTLIKGKDTKKPVRLYLYNGQLSSAEFSDGATHHFSRNTLSENPANAELSFLSFAFLRVTGKEANLKIYQHKDEYLLITESTIAAGVEARIIESLYEAS